MKQGNNKLKSKGLMHSYKKVKSILYPIRMTPYEHERIKKYCIKKEINMSDLFRPVIEKIMKRK